MMIMQITEHTGKPRISLYDIMSIQVCDVIKLVTISRNKIFSVTTDDTHIYVSCKDGKLMIYESIGSLDLSDYFKN